MKRLFRRVGIVAGAQIAGQLIGFAMLAIVSRRIGPANLGAYSFSTNIVAYVGLATTVGLPVLGMREISQSRPGRTTVLRDIVTARILLSLILGGALIATAHWIAPSPASRVLLPILALKLLIDALTFNWYLQGIRRTTIVAMAELLGQLAYAAILLATLADGLTGARRYAIANLLGFAAAAAVVMVYVLRDSGIRWGKATIAALRGRISRSAPFLWWVALTQIYYSTDLVLVAYLRGDRLAGLYAAASKLPLSAIGVAALWFAVAMPEIARLHASNQTSTIRHQTRVAATLAVVAGAPFVLLGPVFARDLSSTFFGRQFAASGPALAILSISVAVSLVQIVVTTVVMGAGRERPYVRAMAIGAAINVILNLILIPTIGIVGAAVSTLVAETIVLAAGIVQLRHVIDRFELRWRPIRDAAAATALAAGVALVVRVHAGFWPAVLGAAAVYAAIIGAGTARNRHWVRDWLGDTS